MRTIVIWDNYGLGPIRFAILKGDYSHLDGVYINDVDDQVKQDELNSIMRSKIEMLDKFPLPLRKDDIVIVAGFLP